MSDDINVSKSYSKKDSNLRGSKSSFQDVANDILNTDTPVKEGKIPTGTQQSKRRTIVGVKPEGLMNSTQISRKSLRDEVPIGQVDNVNIRSSEETKEVPRVSEEYKQDVLTRQAIDVLLGLYKEIKSYEAEVSKRFLIIENKQEEYINLLKMVMETSEDDNTRRIVAQFLIDDQDVYEANKIRYQKEFEEQRIKERKELEDKERMKLQVRLRAEEAELGDEAIEEEELRRLENEARIREEEVMKRKEEELVRRTEENIRVKEDEEFRRKMQQDVLDKQNEKEDSEYEPPIIVMPPPVRQVVIKKEPVKKEDKTKKKKEESKKKKKKKETTKEEEEPNEKKIDEPKEEEDKPKEPSVKEQVSVLSKEEEPKEEVKPIDIKVTEEPKKTVTEPRSTRSNKAKDEHPKTDTSKRTVKSSKRIKSEEEIQKEERRKTNGKNKSKRYY